MKITSKTVSIIGRFCSDPSKGKYVREIARGANISSSTAFRQLKNLSKNNLVREARRGKELLFYLNPENRITAKLCELNESLKTENFLKKEKRFKLVLNEIQKQFADKMGSDLMALAVFGSVAKGEATRESDIDLLIITLPVENKYSLWKKYSDEISDYIRTQYGREIAPIFVSIKEFRDKLRAKDTFIQGVLGSYLIMSGYEYFVKALLER
jgi:predicted nucleotidyltransferase